jgi:hypothetical protein
MPFKVLKQFKPESATVWVERLTESDSIDEFDTIEEAQSKKTELETADNSRLYKIVEG